MIKRKETFDLSLEEKRLSSETIFHGYVIDLELAQVQLPSGQKTRREIVRHAPAVALLAINDQNEMLLMRQWRAAVNKATLEIPAGKVDSRDDSALHAAIRELNEETRLAADKITEVSSFYTSVGFCDEYMTLYLATGLSPVENELPQDEDENLQMIHVSLNQANQMIATGEINDAKTIMAIYYWQGLKLRGELNG